LFSLLWGGICFHCCANEGIQQWRTIQLLRYRGILICHNIKIKVFRNILSKPANTLLFAVTVICSNVAGTLAHVVYVPTALNQFENSVTKKILREAWEGNLDAFIISPLRVASAPKLNNTRCEFSFLLPKLCANTSERYTYPRRSKPFDLPFLILTRVRGIKIKVWVTDVLYRLQLK
jgi:hypothetical protein